MKAIGGYFELELPLYGAGYHDGIELNNARACIDYLISVKKIEHILIPYYSCSCILEPLMQNNISFEYYSIDSNLVPILDESISRESYLIYVNYFGLCDSIVSSLAKEFKNLIVDNTQAFFSKAKMDVDTFYSARKFFGVADGAYLYTNKDVKVIYELDVSYERMRFLLKRLDVTPEDAYSDFQENEALLSDRQPRKMSNITKRILSTIDYAEVAERRRINYEYLHAELGSLNLFDAKLNHEAVPMVYPFMIKKTDLRKHLITNRIYVATYWPEVLNLVEPDSAEVDLVNELIPLPIDQRYDEGDMVRIINVIKEYCVE